MSEITFLELIQKGKIRHHQMMLMEQGDIMKDPLVGKKIVEIRPMTDEETEAEGWETYADTATVIILNNGTLIFASMDTEGNAPGVIFGVTKNGDRFGI